MVLLFRLACGWRCLWVCVVLEGGLVACELIWWFIVVVVHGLAYTEWCDFA